MKKIISLLLTLILLLGCFLSMWSCNNSKNDRDDEDDETGDEIKGEFDLNGHPNDISHKHGVISMARSNDPNSASSQFFICNADATSLDGSYAAFGYVVDGLNVVDKLTEDVFPKTYLSSYYYDFTIDPYYGVTRHDLWNYFGNGAFENQNDQPIIEYIKVLDSRSK